MFAIIAFLLFGVAFVVHGGAFAANSTWWDWQSLTLAGLAFLALHLVKVVGVPWTVHRR